MSTRRAWSTDARWLAGIWLLAAVLRVGYATTLPDRPKYADSEQYLAMAANVLAGNGPMIDSERRAFREPVVPVLLAAVEATGCASSRRAQRIALALVASLLPLATWWLVAEIDPRARRAALWAAFACAVWPHQVYFAPLFLTEGTFSVLLVAAMAALTRLRRRGGRGLAVGAGALLAAAIQTRFSLGLMPVALALVWPALAPAGRRRLIGWVLAGYALAMAPWWIRNAAEFGTFVPHSTHMGHHVWESLGPGATGGPIADHIEFLPRGDLTEPAWDQAQQRQTFAYVADHPLAAVALVPIKIARLYAPLPNDGDHRTAALVAVSLASMLPLYALVALGVWRLGRRLAVDGWPLWVVPAYFTLVHATISFGSVRYRIPFEPFLIALGALGLAPGSATDSAPDSAAAPRA